MLCALALSHYVLQSLGFELLLRALLPRDEVCVLLLLVQTHVLYLLSDGLHHCHSVGVESALSLISFRCVLLPSVRWRCLRGGRFLHTAMRG
jgi:hypothetical protein